MSSQVGRQQPQGATARDGPEPPDMAWLPGRTFRMGSDRHYPEEAPVHSVTVSPFWIDRKPVTNRQFREFVEATGYVTVAEIAPNAKDYPGALPHMLKPGSLVFTPPRRPVDLRDWSQWWRFEFGANWRRRTGRGRSTRASTITRLSISPIKTPKPMQRGPARSCRLKPNGNMPRGAALMAQNLPGARNLRRRPSHGEHLAGRVPERKPHQRRLRAHLAGSGISAERIRPVRHDRQCLGVDHGLVLGPAHRGCAEGLLRAGKPKRRARG